jgi:hypothetical protein
MIVNSSLKLSLLLLCLYLQRLRAGGGRVDEDFLTPVGLVHPVVFDGRAVQGEGENLGVPRYRVANHERSQRDNRFHYRYVGVALPLPRYSEM